MMYWRKRAGPTPDHVFVLVRAGADVTRGTWTRYVDTWREGEEELSCPEATLPLGPKRGFGLLWCENLTVQAALGNPLAQEEPLDGGFQEFVGGTLLWRPGPGHVYALLSDGTWRRFTVAP
jgi:hypothetical protein